SAPGQGNLISGNLRMGVDISADDTVVQGNLIGTDVTGQLDLGNGSAAGDAGVRVFAGADGNRIGGTASGAGNTIAFNNGEGVQISTGVGDDAVDNAILGNSIHDNDDLGIDLGGTGVSPNDGGDADTGPNDLQNFPLLAWAVTGSTGIAGTLNSESNTSYRIEFFSGPVADGSGFGEGETFLGAATTTTGPGGDASFAAVFGQDVPNGHQVTMTATELALGGTPTNTSEFSQAAAVPTPCDVTGTSGKDVFQDTPGDQVYCGKGGGDVFVADSGNDAFIGGSGNDTVRFSATNGPVTVDLLKKTATGDGTGFLTGIERVVGSPQADILKGDGSRNVLKGGPGNDLLIGRGGRDLLVGQGGRDTERGGAGGDTLKGGAANDALFGQGGDDALNGGGGKKDRCRQGPGTGPIRKCEL
ncbi:MAG TPA: calcium-binding protein, partial [Actinomycetota bacterium]|nr:calcium-binding protein [Actinomycetota bacterium]